MCAGGLARDETSFGPRKTAYTKKGAFRIEELVQARAVHLYYIARRGDYAAAEYADEAAVRRLLRAGFAVASAFWKGRFRAGPLRTDGR